MHIDTWASITPDDIISNVLTLLCPRNNLNAVREVCFFAIDFIRHRYRMSSKHGEDMVHMSDVPPEAFSHRGVLYDYERAPGVRCLDEAILAAAHRECVALGLIHAGTLNVALHMLRNSKNAREVAQSANPYHLPRAWALLWLV